MDKLVVLNLGKGNLTEGFPSLTVRLEERLPNGKRGETLFQDCAELHPKPDLEELYATWQFMHDEFYLHRRYPTRGEIIDGIELEDAGITSFSESEFRSVARDLRQQMQTWLDVSALSGVSNRLRVEMQPTDDIEVVIETNDDRLQRLPWQFWSLFDDFPNAEPAFSAPRYARKLIDHPNRKPRILVIWGNDDGLNTPEDHADMSAEETSFRQLDAEFRFLHKPTLPELISALRMTVWDVLFFSGHSHSKHGGQLFLNDDDIVSIQDFKSALQQAVNKGLSLAIFNSCDGLAIARDLAELNIPVSIVMREAVPNQVAQDFLNYFLHSFAHDGYSLHRAVRHAREALRDLDRDFPCADWLPVIHRNPIVPPLTWQRLRTGGRISGRIPINPSNTKAQTTLSSILLICLVATCLIMGVRWVGWLRPLEMAAYDYLVRQMPEAQLHPDILIIGLTKEDAEKQNQRSEPGDKDSTLRDPTLQRLLAKLDEKKARVFGMAIQREQPVSAGYDHLAQRLKDIDALPKIIGVCAEPAQEPLPYSGIKPPPEIPASRVGIGGFIEDSDGVIRRYQVSSSSNSPTCPQVSDSDNTFSYTNHFAYVVATAYLEPQIRESPSKHGILALGNAEFQHLRNHHAGYHNEPNLSSNNMILFHRPFPAFEKVQYVMLEQVLEGKVPDDKLTNKIILAGKIDYLADRVQPPNGQRIPGIYLHAQAVTMLISVAAGDETLLRWMPFWGDGLFTGSWALMSGVATHQLLKRKRFLKKYKIILLGIGFSLVLKIACWLGMISYLWFPLAPALLAIWVSLTGISLMPHETRSSE
jgi:CHASE2 domain-containing sensor protein